MRGIARARQEQKKVLKKRGFRSGYAKAQRTKAQTKQTDFKTTSRIMFGSTSKNVFCFHCVFCFDIKKPKNIVFFLAFGGILIQ